jgi:hypothetical protein
LIDSTFTTPLTHHTGKHRSTKIRQVKTEKIANFRLDKFLENADKFHLPFSLEDLHRVRDNAHTKEILKKECERLKDASIPSRPFSGQYYDSTGKVIFCYFGERVQSQKQKEINVSHPAVFPAQKSD